MNALGSETTEVAIIKKVIPHCRTLRPTLCAPGAVGELSR